MGFPPTAFDSLMLPLGETTTQTLTVPRIFIRRASSGYEGGTLVLTLRVSSASVGAGSLAYAENEKKPLAMANANIPLPHVL